MGVDIGKRKKQLVLGPLLFHLSHLLRLTVNCRMRSHTVHVFVVLRICFVSLKKIEKQGRKGETLGARARNYY